MSSRIGFPETRWSVIGRLNHSAGGTHPPAAAVLIELYADSIGRYLKLKFPGESHQPDFDDIVQEVLLHLFERPELMAQAQPGVGSRFRYLLMTLAYNAARNAARERWRRQHREAAAEMVEEHPADTPSAEDASRMDRAWAESLLAQAWTDVRGWASDGTLEPEVPRLLEGHLVQGRNLRDLAQELGLPLTTCHRRLARGRTYLQRAIIDRLRQAGEVKAGDDEGVACDLLLAVLASS